MKLSDFSLSVKLPAVVVGAACAVALGVGISSYQTASKTVAEMTGQRLNAISEARKVTLVDYLASIEQDLRVTASSPATIAATKEFAAAWNDISGDQTSVLQKAYIEDNPHPTGQKEKLDVAPGNTAYDQVHARYHQWYRTLLQERGYYDIFLFDTEGNLIYSVFKELDYATNFTENGGKWAASDLGKAFRSSIGAAKANTIAFFDFKPYAPSNDAPASFISTPITDQSGKKLGVLVFQMPIDTINTIMSDAAGLGETGETVIVGSDFLMRNDSRFSEETNDILTTKIENPAINEAIEGRPGHGTTDVYRSMSFIVDTIPLEFQGTRWAIATLQGTEETTAPLYELRNRMTMIGLGMLALIALVGFIVSRSITNPISSVVADMLTLAGGDTSVRLEGADRKDEIGDMTRAVVVFRDSADERAMLEVEADRNRAGTESRQKKIDALITSFRGEVQTLLQAVLANSNQMNDTSQTMSGSATETSERASGASSAAEEASVNVQAVATAAEELSASIDEITRQVGQTTQIVDKATADTEATSTKVAGLSEAASRIGNVINLIQDIAEQTNLLALNATIEAARAGESGKGFAVVASEVKALAQQTAKATDEIGAHVNGIQASTGETVHSIQSIAQTMSEVNSFTNSIATAVQQQGSATSEISQSVAQAADGTQKVASNMSGVTAAVAETSQAASQVLDASQDVAAQAEQLRNAFETFLDEVAAA